MREAGKAIHSWENKVVELKKEQGEAAATTFQKNIRNAISAAPRAAPRAAANTVARR